MKRQVAILGPTPPFIAYSLHQPCRLKWSIDERNPEQIERALRPVRLAGQAIRRGYLVDEFVIDPQSIDAPPIRGFHLSDITALHGDWESVAELCRGCPANVPAPDSGIATAGCFGWLATTDLPQGRIESLDEIVRRPVGPAVPSRSVGPAVPSRPVGCRIESFEIVRRQAASPAQQRSPVKASGPTLPGCELTKPVWYGLWMESPLAGDRLSWMADRFGELVRLSTCSRALGQFHTALVTCQEAGLVLDICSYPPGYSDGETWKLVPHCPRCRAPMETDQRSCTTCGRQGGAHPAIHRRVRGLRPLVELSELVGPQRAAQLQAQLKASTQTEISEDPL